MANKQNSIPNLNMTRIKIEPGTNVSNIAVSTNMNRYNMKPENNINIKMEPGTSSITSTQRLTSLKLPRDLKLGGNKSKIVKPNLIARTKQANVNLLNPNARGRGRGRNTDRGRGFDRGRGNLRGKNSNVVQSQGIFSEGISEALIMRRSYEYRDNTDYDVKKVLEQPVFNKNVEMKVDHEQDQKILEELMHSHIDPDDPEFKNDIQPIFLPLKKSDEPNIKLEDIIKIETNGTSPNSNVFENNEKLFLFQFPDNLPGEGLQTEANSDIASKDASGSSTSDKNSSTTPQTQSGYTLRDVNEGLLGKILVYKSGRTQLVIENNKFSIEMGPNTGFVQDVMSVPVNSTTKTGNMINLGSIDGNIIVTPEWNSLLHKK